MYRFCKYCECFTLKYTVYMAKLKNHITLLISESRKSVVICYNIVSWTFFLLCALKLALIFLFSLFLVSETTNDSTMDDVVENHVADQLSSDTTPNAMEAEFSGSSPANLLERPTNHTEALGHDHLGTNDLTVGGFLENHEEPRDKRQCPEENIPASSLNKGKKLMHCRSHERGQH